MKSRLCLVLILVSISSAMSQIDEDCYSTVIELNIRENTGESDSLLFGITRGATYCINESLGETEAPPLTNGFDVRWIDSRTTSGHCLGIGLYPINLQDAMRDTFLISVTYSDTVNAYPLNITWSSWFLHCWQSLVLQDRSNPGGDPNLDIDMLSSSSAYFVKGDKHVTRIRVIGVPYRVNGIDDNVNIPKIPILYQNYPNPFNPTTEVRYRISEVSMVTLKVYDVLGREVTTLVEERMEPGEHTVRWNADLVPSGIYYCRLQSGSFVATRKIVLLK